MDKEYLPEPGKSTRAQAIETGGSTPGKATRVEAESAAAGRGTAARSSGAEAPRSAAPTGAAEAGRRMSHLERARSMAPGDSAPRLQVGASSPQGQHAGARVETAGTDAKADRVEPMTGPREAFNAKFDRELATAARIGAPITATGYLHLHLAEAMSGARAFLASRQLPSGDPQVTLTEDFYEKLFAAFRDGDTAAGVTRLRNWVAPEDLLVIVDRNRPLYEADAALPNAPNAALDYGHGPKGPAAWSSSVGIALGSSIEVRLRESLPRMTQRLLAVTGKKRTAAKSAGKQPEPIRPEELVPSHKLDWAIARAMVAFGSPGAVVKEGTLALRDDVSTSYRRVRVEWNKTAHAVRAIDPVDATIEEVAAAVLKSPTEAYRIRQVGDLFVIPKDADVTRGAGETQADAAHLAFGPDAARLETVEVERAMKDDVQAKAPAGVSFATLQAAWTRVNEQLTALSIVVREYGLEVHLIAAVERHKAHRLDLATLSGKDSIVRAELFARQEELLTRIAADIGSIVSESKQRAMPSKGGVGKSAKAGNAHASADATRMALLKLVGAAGLAHLPETGAAVFAEAHSARRDTMLTTFEELLGDISTQIEIARLTMANSAARSRSSNAVFKTSLQERADALRARLAVLRSKLLAGTADSAEVEALYAAIDALRFETSVIASIGQLGDAFDTLDKLEDNGWTVFSELMTNGDLMDLAQHKDTNRLEQTRQAAFALRGDLQTVHSKWLKVQVQANSLAEQLTAGGISDPHDKALAIVAPQLAIIQGDLAKLGGQAKVRDFLTEAYDKVKSAERRAMILKVAAMIGFAIVSSGVGAMAEGGAGALFGPGLAASAAGLVAETATFSLLNATLSSDSLGHAFVSNFAGNLATFAALRGVSKVLSGTAIGKTLAAVAAGERVSLLSGLAAKAGAITATTLVAVGVQFAQAQYESLLATGKTMSLEELKMAGLQGMAMMIGAAIAHKMLGEGMQEMKALGMRGGAYLKRRARMKQLADAVMVSGNPSTAMELLHETREALDAKGEEIEALGELSDKELEANGQSRATVKAMAHDHKASVAALDKLETGTMSAQLGLDTVVPGQVYAGEPASIARVLDSYRDRPGYRIEREGTGYHVVGRDGTAFHILERAPTSESNANSAASERSGASPTQAAKTEPSSTAKEGTGTSGTTTGPARGARSSSADLDAVVSAPPVLDQVELATGVQKGPSYERDMADLRQFYAEQEAEALHGASHRGRAQEGPYGWNFGHKAVTFSHGVVNFEIRVHLDGSNVSPSELQRLKTQVHAGIDQHYNTKDLTVRGPDGVESRLHVEVVFVDDVSASDLQVTVLPGNGRAFLDTWYVDGDPTTHAHEVTHGGFGIKDEYVDPSVPDRATDQAPGVHNDQSIMGDYWVNDPTRGTIADPRAGVKQRHLDEIGKQAPKAPAKPKPSTSNEKPDSPGQQSASGVDAGQGATSPISGKRSPEAPRAPEGSPQSKAQFAKERTERTKAVESGVSPAKAAVVRDVEGLALDSEWEFEAGQRVGDPLFGARASAALKDAARVSESDPATSAGIKKIVGLSRRLQQKMLDILRRQDLNVAARQKELLSIIGELEQAVRAGESLFPAGVDVAAAFRFDEARAAARDSIDDTFDRKLVMDERGDVHKGQTRLGTFRELVDKVIAANQAFIEAGDPHELVVVDSAVANGKHEILVMSRERQVGMSERGGIALPVQNHPDPNAVIVDVGSGLSSFALDLLQPADRQNGPVVQTEHAPTIVDGARTRRDLSWKGSVPRSDAGSVVVFADPLANMDTLFGAGGVKRVFINNVNAHYSPAQYKQLGTVLSRAMASDGRVEVQWTNEAEFEGGESGTRGHIDGFVLLGAVEAEAAASGRKVEASVDASDRSYRYSVRPSTRVGGVEPGKAVPTDPVPTQKVVIIFGERSAASEKE